MDKARDLCTGCEKRVLEWINRMGAQCGVWLRAGRQHTGIVVAARRKPE